MMHLQIKRFVPPYFYSAVTYIAASTPHILTINHPMIHINATSTVEVSEFTQFLHCVFMTKSRFRWFRSEVLFKMTNPISFWNAEELNICGERWDIEYFMSVWYHRFLSEMHSMYARAGHYRKESAFYEELLWHAGTLSARGEKYFDGND